MNDKPDDANPAKKSATEVLAELVAKRKAASGNPAANLGRREGERAAAARSASKSKPAMRKP